MVSFLTFQQIAATARAAFAGIGDTKTLVESRRAIVRRMIDSPNMSLRNMGEFDAALTAVFDACRDRRNAIQAGV